ncbi:SrfA family protein [Yersinia bercovieri]|uniref:SsrAB-activated protein n=2 Tax=Yersinia bercovieri TaxID=634 RepID=A0A2G4U6V6_YERBE|nr:SrfA family protein [Yersinia bercovieri]EEQ08191.1 hypothetical protein yberc0001_34130 [Yersinia bercovieri ATCC 43970]PHZ28972.1 ssrAB-activated protein [Yersinia bercovieri]QKJ06088.1 ssrAB-activated protein [Yersinia bercovieri ATCC 43970]
MAKIILRSGYLNELTALGENGQTIFDSALQIRETLRLRKQKIVLDCLAIPQLNDAEEKVDWYAPFEGAITPWASASQDQRQHALRYLENCLATSSTISQRCLHAEKTAVQLFGSLMTKALQFPASQYIYLVADKPVITFWGFVNLGDSAREDVLECLSLSELPDVEIADPVKPSLATTVVEEADEDEDEDEEYLADPEPTRVTLSQPEMPLLSPVVATVVAKPIPPSASESSPEKSRALRPRLMPKIIALVSLFVIAPLAYSYLAAVFPSLFTQSESPDAFIPTIEAPIAPMIQLTNTLPLQPAQVVPPPVVVKPPVNTPEREQSKPAKNALVLPAEAVKAGSTKFLNGAWRATIDVKDPLTGKPPSLRYQINNNSGTVRTMHGDNVTCKSDIQLGLMPSGNLSIKSRGQAKCSDGSRYPIPDIICTQPLSGVAQCTGSYAGDTVVPITFIKVSK